jgi:hypothetical protein
VSPQIHIAAVSLTIIANPLTVTITIAIIAMAIAIIIIITVDSSFLILVVIAIAIVILIFIVIVIVTVSHHHRHHYHRHLHVSFTIHRALAQSVSDLVPYGSPTKNNNPDKKGRERQQHRLRRAACLFHISPRNEQFANKSDIEPNLLQLLLSL